MEIATHKHIQLEMGREKCNEVGDDHSDTCREQKDAPRNCAVYAKNLCKNYGDHPVIQNFCMSVRKGSIYGLLGASGCGKTTLISCIVGSAKWKSGDLLIFGEKPLPTSGSGGRKNNIGYMPQDIALYGPLSLPEVIQFYGRLYGMSSLEISERRTFLTKLLNLPENFKRISDYSGGQKRRASLALAMLHSPALLVLDEPTVGLDPLLRIKIWEHLKVIATTFGTTVLITTHYIEEARNSAKVGVMRDGRLLVENTPSNLLQTYECELLEHAVLQICKQSSKKKDDKQALRTFELENKNVFTRPTRWTEMEDDSLKLESGIFRQVNGFDCEVDFDKTRDINGIANNGEANNWTKSRLVGLHNSIRRIYGFTLVLLLTYLRYPLFLALVFILPSIQGGLVFFTYSSKLGGINFGVLNHELINWQNECQMSNESLNSCALSSVLSCSYLHQLTKKDFMVLKQFGTEEDALADVHLGKASGYLMLPANYSQDTLDLATAKIFATNESIEGSRIRIRLDHSAVLSTLLITKYLYLAYLEFVRNTLVSCNIAGEAADLPMNFQPPVFGSYDDDYTSFVMPGYIVWSDVILRAFKKKFRYSLNIIIISVFGSGYIFSFLFGLVQSLTGVIVISDKRDGTLKRARVAGLAATDVLISHLITQTILYTITVIIFGLSLILASNYTIHGSPLLCLALCISTVIYSTALGVLLGILFDREVYVLLVAVFLGSNFVLFSDTFYPKENMSFIIQIIGKIIPTSQPTQALRSVTVRGDGLLQTQVWTGFAAMVPWMVGLSICCVFACKKYL